FFTLGRTISVDWDGNVCHIDGQLLHKNEQITIAGEEPVRFYLTDPIDSHIFDIAGKQSITFGGKSYDDIIVSGLNVDLVLIREHESTGFQLEVHAGDVYHNFSRTKGNAHLEPGDQLFFDGIVVLIREENL